MTKKLPLVIGSSSAARNAWLVGIVAGLAESRIDLTTADLVIGTSAGFEQGKQKAARLIFD